MNFGRLKVFVPNSSSLFLVRGDDGRVTSNRPCAEKLKEVFLALRIRDLEVSTGMPIAKAVLCLSRYRRFLDEIELPEIHRAYGLRFRKMSHLKLNGLWSSDLRTIVIDPAVSQTCVFEHEIGHLVFDGAIEIKTDIEIPKTNGEDFARKLEKYAEQKAEAALSPQRKALREQLRAQWLQRRL